MWTSSASAPRKATNSPAQRFRGLPGVTDGSAWSRAQHAQAAPFRKHRAMGLEGTRREKFTVGPPEP
eukprot:4139069-Alexandrium_andersonii.AAC.1